MSYKNRFSADNTSVTVAQTKEAKALGNVMDSISGEESSRKGNSSVKSIDESPVHEPELSHAVSTNTAHGLCDDFNKINIFTIMGRQRVCLILKLWEIMMLNESLLILADSPEVCSELAFILQSITAPFESSCEIYPYITIFDTREVDIITKTHRKCRDGIVVGATNPRVAKDFEDFPNILRMDREFEENILKKNLIMKTVRTSSL